MMRLCTEAGEHRHYENMCYYYQHATRGEGTGKPSVFLQLFQWQRRVLRHRITEGPKELAAAFDAHVKERLQNPAQQDTDNEEDDHAKIFSGKTFVLSGKLSIPHAQLKINTEGMGRKVWGSRVNIS